ncbi:MAG: serine hydrolase [Lentimicrobiaceae bacterium]|jgi:CubicO group peptidase (beta-lactamase class C family)|nr:serine hydrolase [Lentimicrobiaceae bacterium]
MNKKNLLFSIIFFFFTVVAVTAQDFNQKINKLDSIFTLALEQWNVPGMAVAIVTCDEILLSKGYGITDIKTKQAVDENTLFALASNTKAFTATALAMLVDQNKLSWTDKVRKHMPYFELYDAYVSDEMTVEDLLSHRSGLETFSGDLIWYGSNYTREEVIRKARFLKPKYGFRTTFGYSNILFIAAGELIPQIAGKSWDDFVKESILDRLNMNRSVLHVSDLEGKENVAQPHTYVNGELIQIPWLSWDNMAPAGALISSANDMANWLQMNLSNGIFRGDTLVSDKNMWELQRPRTLNNVYPSKLMPSIHFRAYALGWSLMDYLGKKIVMHNGGYDGMISQTLFIPEANIGLVIMTNSLSGLYTPMMYHFLDIILENETQTNWNELFLRNSVAMEKIAADEVLEIEKSRVNNTKPSLKNDAYTGYYGCPLYDSIQVVETRDGLLIDFLNSPIFKGKMKHWHYDTFQVEFDTQPSLPKGFVTFKINRDGKVEGLEVFVDNPDFDFTEFEFVKLK